MLIGLATLISILFFGGVNEYFLVDKLDKGVKKHVIEKERRKEILTDLKQSEKFIKSFNKSRKAQSKLFKSLNVDRNTSKEELNEFFAQLMKERREFQKRAIADRVLITAKIEPNEWDLIVAMAKESVEKRKEKEKKKIEKEKISPPFEKTIILINDLVVESKRKEILITSLNMFIESQVKTIETLVLMNVEGHAVINEKEASVEELTKVANELNELRESGIIELVAFHFKVKENTNEKEFGEIMKSFNKELKITAH